MRGFACKVLIVGEDRRKRRQLANGACSIMYSRGYRGTVYLAGCDAREEWSRRLGFSPGDEELCALNAGALMDRIDTVDSMANGRDDCVIVYDWGDDADLFPGDGGVRDVCRGVLEGYEESYPFDYVVSVDGAMPEALDVGQDAGILADLMAGVRNDVR